MIDRRGFLGTAAAGGGVFTIGPDRRLQPAQDETRGYLTRQLEIAWALTNLHLEGLTTEECLWRPASRGMHIHRDGKGWRADWPDRESYDIGPPSIGWLTWHLTFWWSMALDHGFGPGTLTREQVRWPGSARAVRDSIGSLHQRWLSALSSLDAAGLRSTSRTRWPFTGRPFGDVVAWANVELMKNASEIGYGRFLFAVRSDR